MEPKFMPTTDFLILLVLTIGIHFILPVIVFLHPPLTYLGMAAILLGTAVILGSLTAFLFPLIFIMLMEIQFIPLEENNCKSVFGEDYEDYRRNVRRWI